MPNTIHPTNKFTGILSSRLRHNKYCPLCGDDNECMTGSGEHGNCWCDQVEFPKGIFELVPEESRRKHCICNHCLTKYKEENII